MAMESALMRWFTSISWGWNGVGSPGVLFLERTQLRELSPAFVVLSFHWFGSCAGLVSGRTAAVATLLRDRFLGSTDNVVNRNFNSI
jgi:hypothetical protein